MIPAILLKSLDPAAAARALRVERLDTALVLPLLKPGNLVVARIEALLPDGSSRVIVSGQPLRMTLPVNVAAGDTLELVFVAHEPRLTFALTGKPPSQSAPVVSAAGRFVAQLMLQQQGPSTRQAASTAPPLVAEALLSDGAELAATLSHAVAQSGLFYESHQAEWLAGSRPLAQLLGEPQARLAKDAQAPPAALRPSVEQAPGETAAGAPNAAHARSSEPVIHPQSLSLVQQQLATLESGRIVWHGEVWRNQRLDWEIGEEPPEEQESNAAPEWQTLLRMKLPQLGDLIVTATLGASGIRIGLDAAAASAAVLKDNLASLHAALAAAGVPAAAIAIRSHESS